VLTEVGEVSGPGVAALKDSVLAPAEVVGAVADDAVLTWLLVEVLEEEEDDADAAVEPLLQVRLYSAALSISAGTMPNEGDGVVGAASWRTYHQVLTSPKRAQPTWSQYVCALAVDATASFSVGPDTGQPVSVTHTDLPLATPTVLL